MCKNSNFCTVYLNTDLASNSSILNMNLYLWVYIRVCKKNENFKVDPIEFPTFFRGFATEKRRILKANPTLTVPELRVSAFPVY